MRKTVISHINNSLQCASIMALGDLLSQSLVEKRQLKDIDVRRSLKYSSLGAFYIGPMLKWWYRILQVKIPLIQSTWKQTGAKVFLDQTIMAPTLNLTTMALAAKVMHNENQQQIIERINQDYLHVMKANYLLWPLVQCINFSVIPLKFQVIFVQCVAVLWYCFLSPIIFNQQQQEKQEMQQQTKDN